MTLLNGMIISNRFKEFVVEFIRIYNADAEEKTMWEFYLHRVYDISFNDFMSKVKHKQTATAGEDREKIIKAIADSQKILAEFKP